MLSINRNEKVKEMIQSVQEWANDKEVRDDFSIRIKRNFIERTTLKKLSAATLHGEWIASYKYGCGVASLVNSEKPHYELFEEAVIFHFCCQCVILESDEGESDWQLVDKPVLWSYCFFYSMLAGASRLAKWYARKMLQEYKSGRFKESNCLSHDYYWFLFCLVSLYLDEDLITDEVINKCGVYRGLIEKDAPTEDDLVKALDFHLEESYGGESNKGCDIILFADNFALFYPLEILACLKIKKVEEIDYSIHPLLEIANKPIRDFKIPEIDEDLALFISEAKAQYGIDILKIINGE